MRVNNSFALALIATVNTVGGCVSAGSCCAFSGRQAYGDEKEMLISTG